jgi:hypothetical protein
MGKYTLQPVKPPSVRNKSISDDELREGQKMIEYLSKHHRLKLGAIKGAATQSYTRALSTKTIMAVDEMLGRDSMTRSVESYDAGIKRSADLFGIVDAVSVDATYPRTRYIQACKWGKGSDWSGHIQKFCEENHIENIRRILSQPAATFELWGWQSHLGFNKDGSRSKDSFWYPRVQIITMAFLLSQEPPTFVKFWEA